MKKQIQLWIVNSKLLIKKEYRLLNLRCSKISSLPDIFKLTVYISFLFTPSHFLEVLKVNYYMSLRHISIFWIDLLKTLWLFDINFFVPLLIQYFIILCWTPVLVAINISSIGFIISFVLLASFRWLALFYKFYLLCYY